MLQTMGGNAEVLVWWQMGIGPPGDAFQDQKRPRAVGPLAARGRKQRSRYVAPLPQALIEHISVLRLDGDERPHVAVFAEDRYKPSAVIPNEMDTLQLENAQACPQQGGNDVVVPQPLTRPYTTPSSHRGRAAWRRPSRPPGRPPASDNMDLPGP
jgi:hypothetical protein